jgi:hypothetical protein
MRFSREALEEIMKANWKVCFWMEVFFVIGFIGIIIWDVIRNKVGFTDLFLPINFAILFSIWAYRDYKRMEFR